MSVDFDAAGLPLSGINVLDLGAIVSAPFAARSLQDLGASVIKVEPLEGDPLRGGATAQGARRFPFIACNRGRRSLAINLKSDAGRAVLYRLVESADVFLENFRPGVTARLGIEYETLKSKNSKLIHCTIGGFAESSPLAKPPNTDGVVQAYAGLLELTGHSESAGMPLPLPLADLIAGTTATEAIIAALFRRERGGEGAHIKVNMFESLLSWMHASAIGHVKLAPPGTWVLRTADGKSILVQPALHFFSSFAHVVAAKAGCDALLADERFATSESRTKHVEALISMLNEAFLKDTSANWLSALSAAGVPAGSINSLQEALQTPEVEVTSVTLDGMEMSLVGSPYVFDDCRPSLATTAPALGEHTSEVLLEAGYSQDEISQLRAERVIR